MQGNMTNMTSQNKVIEQLWYTWSDVGIDTIRAGFRIRAASEGLFDPVSERVQRPDLLQRLNPYQRYSLPRNANRSTSLNSAPVCLALINTGKERILVYKVYTGKDGIGRHGAFFIHLLVNLPEEFSVIDAISLWRSHFWQASDATLSNRKSTHLTRISLEFLRQQQIKKTFDQQTIKSYLPYIIQAYLTKNLKTDTPPAQQKLYIAAPDNIVAQLISGLIQCLPIQLVKDLTFSTYEHDVAEAKTEIVGTCWLSVAEPENSPKLAQLLPNNYYEEKLALNCYTGRRTQLVDHPRAARYAQAAVEHYFLKAIPEFQELLDTVTPTNYPNLTVETLLQLFEMLVVRPQTPSQSDIEATLTARTPEALTRGPYQDKMSHFFLLLNSPMSKEEKNVKLLSQRARLTVPEKGAFLERYGPYYLPDNRFTETLLAMFGDMVNGGNNNLHKEKMRLLFSWFSSPRLIPWFADSQAGQNNLRQILERACLNMTEKVTFLRYYGERYLALYPQLPILSDYVQDFLEYLRSADIAIFKSNSSPEEQPSTTENLLGFLVHHAPPDVLPERISNWYSVARFVRQPSRLKREWKTIAPGIGHLVNTSLSISMRSSLMQELALVCIANEDEVELMLKTLLYGLNILTRPVQEELLYRIAESARDGIAQGKYTKTLLVPCIQYVLGFKHVLYQQEERQDVFVYTFMTTLNIDDKTRKWLNAQAKHWSPDIATAWKRFLAQYSSLAPPSFFERIEYSRERRTAFRQMRRALKDKSMKRILQVGTDYITTLSNYPDEVPAEYWHRLDEALTTVNDFGENAWNLYEAQSHSPTLAQTDLIRSKPTRFAHIKSWWQCTMTLIQVGLAIRSRRLGKIIRIATEHMIILSKYKDIVPDTWWRQLDIAFDIFIALEAENEGTDEDRARAIVAASQKLDQLVDAKHPSLRLIVHEWRSIKASIEYINSQEVQKMGGGQWQQTFPTPQDSFANQMLAAPTPETIAVEQSNQGIFGRFTRWRKQDEER